MPLLLLLLLLPRARLSRAPLSLSHRRLMAGARVPQERQTQTFVETLFAFCLPLLSFLRGMDGC
jgi:hypothetical protein